MKAKRYSEKPVEAIEWTGMNIVNVLLLCPNAKISQRNEISELIVETSEGKKVVPVSGYIVKTPTQEFIVLDAMEFAATYEVE